jgi:hypothetical protein
MEAQRESARAGSAFRGGDKGLAITIPHELEERFTSAGDEFTGYESTTLHGVPVLGLFDQDGGWVRAATQPAPASRYLRQHDWTTLQDLPSRRLMIVAYSPSWPVQWSQDWREAKQRELRPKTKAIAVAIEKAAEALVPLIEEAERKAEIERLEWAAVEQRRLRAEDRKRVDQSVADSRKQLETIISDWDQARATERFFAGIESHAANLPAELRAPIEERLRLARQMLGTVAPLEWFADWKSPGERYEMQYYGPYPRE